MQSGRFLDGFEAADEADLRRNYTLVTRPPQIDPSQRWFLKLKEIVEGHPISYEVVQESSRRNLDAFDQGDCLAVTRERQGDESQEWIFKKVRALPALQGVYFVEQKKTGLALDSVGLQNGRRRREEWGIHEGDGRVGEFVCMWLVRTVCA